jgi:hypothetical protein
LLFLLLLLLLHACAAAAAATMWCTAGLLRTSRMNFLQMGRISLDRVALNIMTCLSWGVRLKMACTRRAGRGRAGGKEAVGSGVG